MRTAIAIALCVVFIGIVAAEKIPPMPKYPTALQTWVQAPDPIYSYKQVGMRKNKGSMTYYLNQTTFHWLTPEDSTQPIWWNLLECTVPQQFKPAAAAGWAMIYIDDGAIHDGLPTEEDLQGIIVATALGVPYCWLKDVPNEPIAFWAEKNGTHFRTEDAIIAYTWMHFLQDTSRPDWLLRFPMVKSLVRAMDTAQDFLPKINQTRPTKFLVSGASKRGWTTWLTPAVDSRVQAIVPISMPIFNMHPAIMRQYEAYGNWTFAFGDYVNEGVINYINTPQFQLLADQVDPMSYLPYLAKVPKYIVFGTNDEFFVPDTPRNFMPLLSKVGGETHLRMAPNFDHPMLPDPLIIINNIIAFADLVFRGIPRPTLTEKIIYSNQTGSIWVMPSAPPKSATLWQATTWSKTQRDFRWLNCSGGLNCFEPNMWLPTTLLPNSDGSYSASIRAPFAGWIGFCIELSYPSDDIIDSNYAITSQVNIVPDRYPFAPFMPPKDPYAPTPTSN